MRANHNPFDTQNLDNNYLEHDNVYIFGTISYEHKYKLFNAIEDVINAKITQVQKMRPQNPTFRPAINFYFACPDTMECRTQTERLFRMLDMAKEYRLTITTTVVDDTHMNSWVGKFICKYATPGFRYIHQDAQLLCNTSPANRRTGRADTMTIDSATAVSLGLFDTLLMNNGRIKTR